jgi:glycosyltransferase involved in cell wall biosynthesis
MRVVFLSGIWPPDVGGPASHGPELARFLVGRGHDVRVVTMADAPPTERPCPVETVSRSRPFPVRYPLVAAKAARAGRSADVIYATATYAAAAAAATTARRPLVVKLVSDPAYERARRWGLFTGTLEGFQPAGGAGLRGLKRARTAALRMAATVVVPSLYLARIALTWGLDSVRVVHVPNPAPAVEPANGPPPERPTFVFAGRLTRQKALGNALEALTSVPEARLLVVGDGPDRDRLAAQAAALDGRVEFLGALPRAEVLAVVSGATAAVLPSDWENLPHAVVEALALGVPIVATSVGGVPEVVDDGVNGLLVPPGDVPALAAALGRISRDQALRDRLAAAAPGSVAELSGERVYGRIEKLLLEAAG